MKEHPIHHRQPAPEAVRLPSENRFCPGQPVPEPSGTDSSPHSAAELRIPPRFHPKTGLPRCHRPTETLFRRHLSAIESIPQRPPFRYRHPPESVKTRETDPLQSGSDSEAPAAAETSPPDKSSAHHIQGGFSRSPLPWMRWYSSVRSR